MTLYDIQTFFSHCVIMVDIFSIRIIFCGFGLHIIMSTEMLRHKDVLFEMLMYYQKQNIHGDVLHYLLFAIPRPVGDGGFWSPWDPSCVRRDFIVCAKVMVKVKKQTFTT